MGYTYNNVTLQECQTLEFTMETERDPSGTDVLWYKYTVRVRGFVSGSIGQFRQDTPTALAELKDKLETPRRPFRYAIGGVTLVEHGIAISDGPVDAHLGPEPMKATVREVTSGCFAVECGVIVRLVQCNDTCENRNPVVSLRWKQTESFDQNWYSRLVTEGFLIVRSDLLQSADSFRPLATPPLLQDYQRIRSEYTLSEDGTKLSFRFEDQEFDRLPPYPATKAKGHFLVSVTKNTMRVGRVHVELEGQKGTSRRDLMMRAISICYSRIAQENPGINGGLPILDGEFYEDLFEPKVMVSISGLLQPLGGPSNLAGAWLNSPVGGTIQSVLGSLMTGGVPTYFEPGPIAMPSVGADIPGTRQGRPGIRPPDRKRIAALLAAAFRDPCVCEGFGETSLSTGGRSPGGEALLRNIAPGAPVTATLRIGVPTPLTTSAVAGPPTYYNTKQTTRLVTGSVPMPGTGSNSPGGSPGTAELVKINGGYMMVNLIWTAMRIGQPPVIPGLVSKDPNIKPIQGAVVAENVVPSPDGSALVYSMAGWLEFMVVDPTKYNAGAPTAPNVSTAVTTAAQTAMSSWVPTGAAASPTISTQSTPSNPLLPQPGETQGVFPELPQGFAASQPLSTIPGLGGFQDLSQSGGLPPPPPGFEYETFFEAGGKPALVPIVNP